VTHEEARELIPGYAVDALAPEEARALEEHVEGCEACRRELAALRDTAAELAAGLSQVAPPDTLRARALGAARSRPGRGAVRRPWAAWALAAAAILIVLVGIQDVTLQRQITLLDSQVNREGQLLALLTSPSSKTVELSGTARGSVHFVFNPGAHEGLVIAGGLGNPGPRSVYQVWLISGAMPSSIGVLSPGKGQTTILFVRTDFRRYQAIAVSVEPGPAGSPAPTTKPVLSATLPGTS